MLNTSVSKSVRKSHLIAYFVLAAAFGGLSACGGGGSSAGPPPPTFSVSSNTLTFTAASPFAAAPAGQIVSATVNGTLSGVLYIVVDVAGTAGVSVGNFIVSGNSGQGTVTVFGPQTLGIGTYSGTLTIHACVNDQTCKSGELAGSPQTVSVTYTISGPTPPAAVLPHVVAAGTGGQVVIRGPGLNGTTGVSFNGTAGTSVSVISDTEVHASYPATLSAGPVSVVTTGSATAFNGTFVAIAAQALPATTLTYPTTTNLDHILAARYDGERQVLYVAAAFTSPANNVLWRYTYNSGAQTWNTPQSIAIPSLRDVELSNDGTQLYVLTDTTVSTFDAANPVAPTQTVIPNLPPNGAASALMASFAFADDGNAVITTGYSGTFELAPSYLYTPSTGTFQNFGGAAELTSDNLGAGGLPPTVVASGDGTRLYADGGAMALFQYDPATEVMAQTLQWQQPAGEPAAIDNQDSRLVLMTGGSVVVSRADYSIVGVIQMLSSPNILATVNPQGSRVYVFTKDPNTLVNQLWTFDATTVSQIGVAATGLLPAPAAGPLRTAFSPDGLTLFVAGNAGVAVIQAPQ